VFQNKEESKLIYNECFYPNPETQGCDNCSYFVPDNGGIFSEVARDLIKHILTFDCYHSTHEGYALIRERVEQLWDSVESRSPKDQRETCIRIAAMAIRFIIDFRLEKEN
jgi:hypothetical protein